MKVKPNVLIESMSGKVFGNDKNVSMRMHYGQLRSYTYKNKPESWSEAQTNYRRLYGACSYVARLILRIDAAKARYTTLKKEKGFHRMDNYVALQVKALCVADDALCQRVLAANAAHKKVQYAGDREEALKQEQMPLAEEIWQRLNG